MKKFIVFILLTFNELCNATTLEDLFDGIETCEFNNVYYDVKKKTNLHPYFMERNLRPNRIENSLAFYDIEDKFHGLPVVQIIIPVTFNIHGLVLDASLSESRSKFEMIYGEVFERNERSVGKKPVLESIKNRPNQSFFGCDEVDAGL
jgi:hypothetical protein